MQHRQLINLKHWNTQVSRKFCEPLTFVCAELLQSLGGEGAQVDTEGVAIATGNELNDIACPEGIQYFVPSRELGLSGRRGRVTLVLRSRVARLCVCVYSMCRCVCVRVCVGVWCACVCVRVCVCVCAWVNTCGGGAVGPAGWGGGG